MSNSYKSILVLLNHENFVGNTMDMAASIARQYDAHVTGLYVIPSHIIYTMPYGYGGPIVYTEATRMYKSQSSKVEQAFRDFIRKENIIGEWRQINSGGHFTSDAVAEQAREADLIILGHDTSIKKLSPPDVQFYANILQSSGRPVLIAPNIHNQDLKFKEAVIGWDGSRESARAAFDAIPLLKMSERTFVTSFNPHKEADISKIDPGRGLSESLSRHGISVNLETIRTRKRISRAIAERAESADLLVIGAYSHSRLRENILGGVTKHILSSMPCAILMSH